DADGLRIFGEDPAQKEPELILHSSVAIRWKKYLSEGLKKEVKDSLMEKYPRKGKLSFEPPILNDKVAVNLKESALKRDKYFGATQKLAGSALAALAPAIESLAPLRDAESMKRLEQIWDAAKLLIEIHRSQTDKFIIQTVKGYKIPFESTPFQINPPPSRNWSEQESAYIQSEIDRLLSIGAIVEAEEVPDQFLSSFFLVPKSDGQQRFILNLKKLNTFIAAEHFKLEDLRSACSLLEQGIFMGTIDLKDAYFLLPVWKPHCKFLRFLYNEKIYEFVCLPFGLCTCPLTFTKLLKPVINYLRSNGWLSVVYLDDFLCLGQSIGECSENLTQTIVLLERLGFIVNYEKSKLVPERKCKYLGFILDSVSRIWKIRNNRYEKTIYSDASLSGWGAFCNGEDANRSWDQQERSLYINHLELKAALLALKCFAADLRDLDILLMVDNSTTLAYINKMGGVRFSGLHELACELWDWCEVRRLWVYATYIPSKENVEADRSSRIDNSDAEWELADYAFEVIAENFGKLEIDLFASRINTKCVVYCSWKRDPGALAFDAFTISWSGWMFYAFPPFSIITRVIKKIKDDKAEGVLVVPHWPTQVWFPTFQKL
ncbi:GSCOCG00002711001-RA-CDS, partial [Cotesia congregata]